MNWQPIETAPKDGTEFLGFDRGDMMVCWWEKSWGGGGGYWTKGQQPAYEELGVPPEKEKPTHWQPLPQPPEPAGGGDED